MSMIVFRICEVLLFTFLIWCLIQTFKKAMKEIIEDDCN